MGTAVERTEIRVALREFDFAGIEAALVDLSLTIKRRATGWHFDQLTFDRPEESKLWCARAFHVDSDGRREFKRGYGAFAYWAVKELERELKARHPK